MSFYERLDSLLKQKNISHRKMIIDFGLVKNTMYNWKHRGNIPNGEVLLKLSEYLDVSVDYLLCNDKYCVNEDERLFTLPCEVGSTVYLIGSVKSGKKSEQTVISGQIDRFIIGGLGVPLADICTDDNAWYYACAYPKDYFLTREEAQNVIKKSSSENRKDV